MGEGRGNMMAVAGGLSFVTASFPSGPQKPISPNASTFGTRSLDLSKTTDARSAMRVEVVFMH